MEPSENEAWPLLDVPDDAIMLRRIPPWLFNPDKGAIYDKAFANDRVSEHTTDRHSVNWEERTSVEDTLSGHEGFGVAAITVQGYCEENQSIEHSPDRERGNYGHCDAVGAKTARVQRRLRQKAELRVQPTPQQQSTGGTHG